MKAGKAEEALGTTTRRSRRCPTIPACTSIAGTALYALSRFEEAGARVPARDRGQGRRAQGAGLLQPGQRVLQEGKVQGGGRGVQARAGPGPARRAREVEPGDRAAKEEGRRRRRRRTTRTRTKTRTRRTTRTRKTTRRTRTRTTKTRIKDKDKKDDQKKDQDKDRTTRTSRISRTETRTTRQSSRPQPNPADEQEIGAVLDSLERAPRTWRRSGPGCARCAARPPARDW